DITAMARALFTDPEFDRSDGQVVKQPVEWAVGAMRQLGIRPRELSYGDQVELIRRLKALAQVPFKPPSVAGWPSGSAWLSTSAAQARLRAADFLAAHAGAAVVDRLNSIPLAQRPVALTRLLVVPGF